MFAADSKCIFCMSHTNALYTFSIGVRQMQHSVNCRLQRMQHATCPQGKKKAHFLLFKHMLHSVAGSVANWSTSWSPSTAPVDWSLGLGAHARQCSSGIGRELRFRIGYGRGLGLTLLLGPKFTTGLRLGG